MIPLIGKLSDQFCFRFVGSLGIDSFAHHSCRLSYIHLFIYPSNPRTIHRSTFLSTHLPPIHTHCIYSCGHISCPVHTCVHPTSSHLSISSFVHLSSIHLAIIPPSHPLIHLSIQPVVHPLTHPAQSLHQSMSSPPTDLSCHPAHLSLSSYVSPSRHQLAVQPGPTVAKAGE